MHVLTCPVCQGWNTHQLWFAVHWRKRCTIHFPYMNLISNKRFKGINIWHIKDWFHLSVMLGVPHEQQQAECRAKPHTVSKIWIIGVVTFDFCTGWVVSTPASQREKVLGSIPGWTRGLSVWSSVSPNIKNMFQEKLNEIWISGSCLVNQRNELRGFSFDGIYI